MTLSGSCLWAVDGQQLEPEAVGKGSSMQQLGMIPATRTCMVWHML